MILIMIVPSVDQNNGVKKLIECNRNYHCPKTLPKCHQMERRSSGIGNRKHHNMVKKSYCVFRTCQYCQNKRNCPTLGNVCTSGSLSGKCNADLNTCEYNPFLAISHCPGPGKVKIALVLEWVIRSELTL